MHVGAHARMLQPVDRLLDSCPSFPPGLTKNCVQAGADITGKALNLYDPLIPELKLSPTLLLTLIAQIYLEKIASDRVRERQDNEPLDFPPPMTGTPIHLDEQ